MRKITSTLLAVMLVLTTLVANPFGLTETIVAEEVINNEINYNDYTSENTNWRVRQGDFSSKLNDGSLDTSTIGDTIAVNDDDQVRNNGDAAVRFVYQTGMGCFGFVIRENNGSIPYQNVVFDFRDQTMMLGNTTNWVTLPTIKKIDFEVGKSYNYVARYEGDKLKVFINGETIFNGIVDAGAGLGPIDGTISGKTGLRMYCGNQNITIESFVTGPLNSIPDAGFPDIGKDLTYYNFNSEVTTFENKVGDFSKKYEDGKLKISNNVAESILYDTADKVRKSGDVEMDFNYKFGQRCFGPTFRSGANTSEWQVVSIGGGATGDLYWQVGHPSGYWSDNYPMKTKMENGKDYKMVVRYKGSGVKVYLNGLLELDLENVSTPKGNINPNDSEGTIGFRKHCIQQEIQLDRLISADYGVIPNEGMSNINRVGESQTPPEVPTDPEENKIFYKGMRDLWREHKVGNFTESDLEDVQIKNHISNVVEDADKLIKEIQDQDVWATKGVWPKKESDTHSANITTQFKNLNKITQAYMTESDENIYYKNANLLETIENALEILTEDKWFDGKKVSGNWWDFQVGIPQELADILILLYDELPTEKVIKYAEKISAYIPNAERQIYGTGQGEYIDISFGVVTTGANRTDLALTYLATGILLEREAILKDIVPSIESVFNIKTSGDGFYADGSYIQHGDVPYTGSYGNIAVKGVGKILSYLEGSPWQLSDEKIDEFSKLVYDAFIPVIYKGETMPMVGGRSISRAPGARKEGFGSATIFNLLIVSNFASEPYKSQLKEAAKYWILEDTTDYYFNNNRDLRDLLEVKSVLKDTTVKGDKVPFIGGKMFAGMDRFVHSNDNYSLGLSMYSSRISAFESGNNENKKGWFTSDGMMYIQNNDKMFGESYWPTVDWYRLPGTTVDTRPLNPETSGFTRTRSPQSYVGGTTDGSNSSVAMVLNKNGFKNNAELIGYDLKAFKSWFVSDDVIYALGAGINGTTTDGNAIETIVENRLMDDKMGYVLKSNIDFENNSSLKVKKGDWFILEANDSRNNIAYVFYEDHDIKLVQETNTGQYADINSPFVNNKTYTETYQKIIIDHGQTVVNGSYAYAVLPGVTQSELEAYLDSDVEILTNTQDEQGVRVGGVTLGTIYPDKGGRISDLEVVGAPTFIVDESDTDIKVHVADAKQKDSNFEFIMNRDYLSTEDGNQSINSKLPFTVNNTGKRGGTTTIKLIKNANLEIFNEKVAEFDALDVDLLTTYSKDQYDDFKIRIDELSERDDLTQEIVDAFVTELSEFLETVDLKIDFDYAVITIEFIQELDESIYSVDSWNTMLDLAEKLQSWIDSYDDTKALVFSQTEVDELLGQLQLSINNLELKEIVIPQPEIDTSVLEEQVALFGKLSKEDYSHDPVKLKAFTALESYVLTAKDMIAGINALSTEAFTQADVDELVVLMKIEFKILLGGQEAVDPVEPENGGNGSSPILPETGITSNYTLLVSAMVLILLGYGLLKFKREEDLF